MLTLKQLLASASALLGLTPTPAPPPGGPKLSLASVLAARLQAYRSLAPSPHAQDGETQLEGLSEKHLQRLTAHAALDVLERLASHARSPRPPPPSTASSSSASSTTAAPPPPPPPMFGARDIKTIGMLAGVVGRWGISDAAGLGGAGAGERKLNEPKIREVVEEEETAEKDDREEKRQRLADLVKRVLVGVLGFSPAVAVSNPPSRTDAEKQLVALVLPQLLVPLVGGLVLLSQGDGGEKWAADGLEKVFRSVPATTALSTLLTLLASAPAFPPSRLPPLSLSRTHLSALLSHQLLRPGGVRSLLIVVVGVGAAAGGQEDEAGGEVVGERKMEMVRRLLSAAPPPARGKESGEERAKAHFTNLTSQLLDILFTAATTSVTSSLTAPSSSSSSAKGKSSAAQSAPKSPAAAVNVPLPILRAACYVLAHFLVASPFSPNGGEALLAQHAKSFLLAALHAPLLPLSRPSSLPLPSSPASFAAADEDPAPLPLLNPTQLLTHLTALSLLLSFSPPLPSLLSSLLSPLLPALFALLSHLAHPPLIVSNPTLERQRAKTGAEDEVRALLGAYAKGGGEEAEEVVRGVARAVEVWERGEEFGAAQELVGGEAARAARERVVEWAWADNGAPQLVLLAEASSPHFSPLDAGDEEDGGPSPSLDALQLRVDPPALVQWLKDDVHPVRREVAAGLFLRWLDEVRVLQGTEGVEGAKRSITRLQLILQLVEALGGVSSASNDDDIAAAATSNSNSNSILTEPAQIVAFVAHALEGAAADAMTASSSASSAGATRGKKPAREKEKGGLAGLRIVDEEGDEGVRGAEEVDEEDEAAGLGTGLGKDEMAMTALTLLLAVLEANPSLSESNTPLLPVIASQLSLLAAHSPSAVIAPLAREAKMVLSLRRAATSFSGAKAEEDAASEKEDPLAASRQTYRTALKLLQDPLLPVRAQGLTLLRSLVLDRETALLSTDPALLPAVLDIFVGAVEEEDSFLYLNAVQGLRSLVDVYGAKVIGRLAEVYTGARAGERVKELGKGEMGKRELDKRLRVGEALVQVVQRAGEALATLTPHLLPPLLSTLLTPSLPIPLRSSSLTILATCVETAPTAMLPHAETLAEACVGLLEVETVALKPRLPPAKAVREGEKKRQEGKGKGKGVLIEVSSSDSDDDDDDDAPPKELPNPLNRPRRPEELPNPLTSSSKHPTLRRAALVFLAALVQTVAAQVAEQREKEQDAAWRSEGAEGLLGGKLRLPGQQLGGAGGFLIREHRPAAQDGGVGLLIGAEVLVKARRVLRYVGETDEDALVRHQAGEVLQELEE
ncbi:hypothetical protein JCM6882_001639 [Rhodosporidiobolus microsporus]